MLKFMIGTQQIPSIIATTGHWIKIRRLKNLTLPAIFTSTSALTKFSYFLVACIQADQALLSRQGTPMTLIHLLMLNTALKRDYSVDYITTAPGKSHEWTTSAYANCTSETCFTQLHVVVISEKSENSEKTKTKKN